MTAKLCTICGATVIPATGANGKPIELDAAVPVLCVSLVACMVALWCMGVER